MPLVAATVKRKWADEHSLDDVAIRELADGVYTRSAMKSSSARVDWWRTRAAKRGLAPFPLTSRN